MIFQCLMGSRKSRCDIPNRTTQGQDCLTWHVWEFSRLPFGNLEIFSYFNVVLVTIYKVYYRDDNGEFSQIHTILNHANDFLHFEINI